MNMLASIVALLAVMFLPEGYVFERDESVQAEFLAEADSGNADPKDEVKSARIRANRTDLDREDGVVMFEDDVFVEYSTDYTMNAERLYVIFKGTNALSRIVASGGVTLTNDTRCGSCEMAVFRNLERRIEMYGKEGAPAKLVERSGDRSSVSGSKIVFWIDTEQVQVTAPTITMEEKDVR